MVEQPTNQSAGDGSIPISPLQFSVRTIPSHQTYPWLLKKHYAHTLPNIMYSFGLYDNNTVLQGVCCYGTPANNHNNMMGDFKQIELVRLIINENLPKNILSYFVSKTFLFLEKPISLISYADKGKNHHGYIYQATNWLYTGLGGGVDFYLDTNDKEIHSRVMSDLRLEHTDMSRAEIAIMFKWRLVKGTYKHRYFYFLGNKRDRAVWLKTLLEKYPRKSYPKGDNIRYDASYTPQVQGVLI